MVKRFFVLLSLLVCVCLLIRSDCELGKITMYPVLGVPKHAQETNSWCWAASAQMVMEYHGKKVSQCVQANNRFGRTDCCNITLCPNPVSKHPCVKGGWPEFNKYGFSFKTSSGALSWSDVKNQISNKRPFCVAWAWIGEGGHMMVAEGCHTTVGGENYVAIVDPWPPCQGDDYIITYDYYNAHPGHHTHSIDYYDIIPKP